jgi:hypothetical protein
MNNNNNSANAGADNIKSTRRENKNNYLVSFDGRPLEAIQYMLANGYKLANFRDLANARTRSFNCEESDLLKFNGNFTLPGNPIISTKKNMEEQILVVDLEHKDLVEIKNIVSKVNKHTEIISNYTTIDEVSGDEYGSTRLIPMLPIFVSGGHMMEQKTITKYIHIPEHLYNKIRKIPEATVTLNKYSKSFKRSQQLLEALFQGNLEDLTEYAKFRTELAKKIYGANEIRITHDFSEFVGMTFLRSDSLKRESDNRIYVRCPFPYRKFIRHLKYATRHSYLNCVSEQTLGMKIHED